MKPFRLVHVITTLVLLLGVVVFVVLWFAGVIDVRPRPAVRATEQHESNEVGTAKARLVVTRGLRPNWEYRIFEGRTILGRADEQPVDVDLQPLEPEDRIWSSRQHAAITCERGVLTIEDLNSTNGTYLNRTRVPPGEKRPLRAGDTIQIGEVQLKVVM